VYNNIYAASSISIAGNAVATQPWVNANFAALGHTHGNSYLKSAVSQGIACQLYSGYLEIFQIVESIVKRIDISLRAIKPAERQIIELRYFQSLTWWKQGDFNSF